MGSVQGQLDLSGLEEEGHGVDPSVLDPTVDVNAVAIPLFLSSASTTVANRQAQQQHTHQTNLATAHDSLHTPMPTPFAFASPSSSPQTSPTPSRSSSPALPNFDSNTVSGDSVC
eukprot:TRINITY_DN15670_c0_g1_i5.p2 TRINITY_DN15670_c0_g1~~TRINITY_DN15670_c0_g1_i5.p2  ORF type:complete len:115 (+),score=35.98 TRINITY_DN15670_c0_g1_i5:211-555(+)